MSDPSVTLRLVVNADGVVTGTRLAAGEVAKLGNSAEALGAQAEGGFGRARRGVESISQQLKVAQSSLLAFIGAANMARVISGVVQMSDAWSDMTSLVRVNIGANEDASRVMGRLADVARSTYSSLEDTARGFARNAATLNALGKSTQQQLDYTEALNNALVVSGAKGQTFIMVQDALAKAMATGALRGDELNTVLNSGSRVARALAEELGTTVIGLRKMGEDGKITGDVIFNALTRRMQELHDEAETMPATVGDAFTLLRNAVLQAVGEMSDAFGAGSGLSAAIIGVSQHVTALAQAIGGVLLLAMGRLGAAVIQYLVVQKDKIAQSIGAAAAELAEARAAQQHAVARVADARAGILAAGQLAAAETALTAAEDRLALATQRASIAFRAQSAAMAAVGGPVGIVVIAITAVIGKIISMRGESEQMTQAMTDGIKNAKQALDDFNRSPSLQAGMGLKATSDEIRRISKELDELREKQENLRPSELVSKTNVAAWLSYKLAIGDTTEQIHQHEAALREIDPAFRQAVENETDLLEQMLGVGKVSPVVRSELYQVAQRIIETGHAGEDAQSTMMRLATQLGATAQAAYFAQNGIDAASSSMSALASITSQAEARMAAMRVRLATLQGGAAAGIRVGYANALGSTLLGPGDAAKLRKEMEAEIALQAQLAAAEAKAAAARRANSAATRDQSRDLKQAAESQARYTAQAALAAAELQGPLALAQEQSKQKIAELDAAYAKHNITLAAYTTLKQAEEAALAKIAAENAAHLAAPQALLDTMTGELRLLQLIGPERERERQRLQAQADMQRALAEASDAAGSAAERERIAVEHGYQTWEQYKEAMLAASDANVAMAAQMEESAAQAEDWAKLWKDAVGSVADAFTEFVMSGLRDFKGLWKSLKSIAKQLIADLIRTFLQQKIVIPIQAQITQIFAGGGSLFGSGGGQGGLAGMFSSLADTLLGGFAKLFGRGGSATTAIAEGTGTAMDGWFNQLKQSGGLFGMAGVPMGDVLLPGQQGANFGGIGMSPWMSALFGAVMGFGLGGDTLGKLGGGLAGGALGYGLMGAYSGFASGGLAGALSGFGAAGWIGLAAFALNAITGGKLFGTKWGAESGAQQFDIGASGASGYNSITEVRQKSFFRGREWRTTQTPLDAQAQQAINELFETLKKTVAQAAGQLGIAVPAIVGGSFRREFDKNGNLTKEFGTIAGRVYYEAQDAFAQRLIGENLLAVAKAAGSADELEQLANAYRGTGEQLQAFATAALAIQEDLLQANGIWAQVDGDGVMTRIVHYIEGMAKAGESLADAYARIQKAITDYGTLIGGARQYIATHDLNQYQKSQLQVELQYREMVKQANDLAKALGLSGARSEDLATLEQWRALQMADLAQQYAAQQAQNDQWLQDLSLSNLSPLTDQQKLDSAMQMLQEAAASGDMARAQKLAEQVLNLGHNLYASGQDYNDLYDQVTGLVGDLSTMSMEELQGLTNDELANIADLISGLPAQIAQEIANAALDTYATNNPTPAVPAPSPTPVPPPPGGGGGGGGGGGDIPESCVAATMRLDDGTTADLADAGDVHGTHDPVEGFMRRSIRYRGKAVMQPCVRLMTRGGAALVCSASTPFTAVGAPADLPEYTTLAPDMHGRDVYVRRGGTTVVERVLAVHDIGWRLVVPLDFGGRSFAAGEDGNALIYSHNMMKSPGGSMGVMVGEPDPSGGGLGPFGNVGNGGVSRIEASLATIAGAVIEQNRKIDRLALDRVSEGSPTPTRAKGLY